MVLTSVQCLVVTHSHSSACLISCLGGVGGGREGGRITAQLWPEAVLLSVHPTPPTPAPLKASTG